MNTGTKIAIGALLAAGCLPVFAQDAQPARGGGAAETWLVEKNKAAEAPSGPSVRLAIAGYPLINMNNTAGQ